jgi:peptidoglycan/LPS O-acetylase OafA/YrhL
MDVTKYRPDIDGLRAIAVISVLLFHLGFESFGGGFVGVDVFFVISGYLITGLIRDEVLQSNTFSYRNFYIRRARRLFPAFIFTLIVCLVCAFLLFAPSHFERFAHSSIFSVLSLSNFYFWSESGYFDTDSIFKPLLHFWSLSVEEQFYLIWPVVLVTLMLKAREYGAPLFLFLIGTISLWLNIIFEPGIEMHFDLFPTILSKWFSDGPTTIFYLIPFRVFEFAMGAMMVWATQFPLRKSFLLQVIVLIGLALIIWPILTFTEETVFPSVNALIPCIGTVLVIYASTSSLSMVLLGNPLASGIGKISYSLYLIHWPIFVFYRYYKFDVLNRTEELFVIAISFVAAAFMYRYVEQPYRQRRGSLEKTSNKAFVSTCVGIGVVLLASSIFIIKNDGAKWRIWQTTKLTNKEWGIEFRRTKQDSITKKLKKVDRKASIRVYKVTKSVPKNGRVLVIGDSHAGRLYPLGRLIARKYKYDVYFVSKPCWIPIHGEWHTRGKDPLDNKYASCSKPDAFWDVVKDANFELIISAGRWTHYLEDEYYGQYERDRKYFVRENKPVVEKADAYNIFKIMLNHNSRFLLRITDNILYIAQPPPPFKTLQYCNQVPRYLIPLSSLPERCRGADRSVARQRMIRHEATLQRIARVEDVYVLKTFDMFCPENDEKCTTYDRGQVLFSDNHHLNKYGATYLAKHKRTISVLDKIFAKQVNLSE